MMTVVNLLGTYILGAVMIIWLLNIVFKQISNYHTRINENKHNE